MIKKKHPALFPALILASMSAHAQPPSQFDYLFANAIPDGAAIAAHKAVRGSLHYVGPVAFGDSGEVVFLAEFSDAAKRAVRGIYSTAGRTVVEEGDTFSGITIRQVINTQPGQLQTNRLGQTAYLGLFDGKGCGVAPCTGLFVDRTLMAVAAGVPGSYLLTDFGRIAAPTGHTWLAPVATGTVASTRQPSWLERHTGAVIHLSPIKIPVGTVQVGGSTGPTQQPGTVQIGGANTIPLAGQAPQPGQKLAQFEALGSQPFCPLPAGYPYPFLWGEGANAAGPIASSRGDVAYEANKYHSAYHSNAGVGAWVRKAYFAADCRVILVSVMAFPGPGATELWTPAGLVGHFDAAVGAYKFNGVPDVTLPAASSPLEDNIRINRNCSVAIPVSFKRPWGEEPGLIIGNPTKPGHCAQ